MITPSNNLTHTSLDATPHFMVEPFTPPVPLLLCLVAAVVVVIASFILLAFFARNTQVYFDYPRVSLLQWNIVKLFNRSGAILLVQIISVFLFVLVVVTGFFGNSDPIYNLAPTFVWVIWWVGVAYASAFLGNVWSLLNPWKIIFGWVEQLWLLLHSGRTFCPILQYPTKIGVWPALFLFLVFAWIENVYAGAVIPSRISQMILLYSVITWAGMFLYGKDTWLRYGEAFSLAFGFLARFAPIQARLGRNFYDDTVTKSKNVHSSACETESRCSDESHSPLKGVYLQPFASGLLDIEKVSVSQTLFVLLLLATVTFDGFTSTLPWMNIQNYIIEYVPNVMLISTLGLVSSVLIFVGVYFCFAALMRISSGSALGTLELAKTFVYTLIPIALAYHVAHFLLFLLIQGQMIIPLASDPFGFDWDLFGTTNYRVNFMLVSQNFFWVTSVLSILLGHVIAVFLSHIIALRVIKSHRHAIRSQYPMLALMVGYTVASLWIITQPMYA